MELENDRDIDRVSERASALKNITIDIHDEVGAQRRMLDEQSDDFARARDALREARARSRRSWSRREGRDIFGKSCAWSSSSSSSRGGRFPSVAARRLNRAAADARERASAASV